MCTEENELIFSDEVFMISCCIGNMSSLTLSNLCRLLCIVVAITVSCCCCPAIVIVYVQLQMNHNNNNNNNNNNNQKTNHKNIEQFM